MGWGGRHGGQGIPTARCGGEKGRWSVVAGTIDLVVAVAVAIAVAIVKAAACEWV